VLWLSALDLDKIPFKDEQPPHLQDLLQLTHHMHRLSLSLVKLKYSSIIPFFPDHECDIPYSWTNDQSQLKILTFIDSPDLTWILAILLDLLIDIFRDLKDLQLD
jgi:hypothetical protein